MTASRKGDIERIRRLLDEGATVNFRGKYGYTPLMEAASHGHLQAVQFLLDSGANPRINADDNASPMFYACVRGHFEVVDLLLRNGADPNITRNADGGELPADTRGVSLLHVALRNGFDGIALALINAGARIDHVTRGKTPLHVAIELGMSVVVERIREVDRRRQIRP